MRLVVLARDYLWFLRQLGFRCEQIRFYFYEAAPGSLAEQEWRKALRLTKKDQIGRRRPPNPNDPGAASWIGIEPVVWPEATRNNASGAFGYRYVMVLASILLAGDGLGRSRQRDRNKVSLPTKEDPVRKAG